jgi:hypothetical protein
LVRPDGRGLDPDASSGLAARAVAALASAGFRGHELQLYLALRDPAPALTPGEAGAARGALGAAGFDTEHLGGLLREDGLGLVSLVEPEPHVMAQIAVVLADAGFPTFHICQVGRAGRRDTHVALYLLTNRWSDARRPAYTHTSPPARRSICRLCFRPCHPRLHRWGGERQGQAAASRTCATAEVLQPASDTPAVCSSSTSSFWGGGLQGPSTSRSLDSRAPSRAPWLRSSEWGADDEELFGTDSEVRGALGGVRPASSQDCAAQVQGVRLAHRVWAQWAVG